MYKDFIYILFIKMLFIGKIKGDSFLQLTQTQKTLVITNISLVESDSASLYLQQESKEQKWKALIVTLQKPNFQAYHTELRLKFSNGNIGRLKAVGGSVHIIGYYLQDQRQKEVDIINEALKNVDEDSKEITITNPQKQQKTNRYQKRQKRQRKVQQQKKVSNSTTKNKNIEQTKSKVPKKAKSLLQMMKDLDDNDDEQQSDYQEQQEPQSSDSSSSDQEQTPKITKKQTKQAKSERKEQELKRSKDEREKLLESKLAFELDQQQYKLLRMYPNLLHYSLNLASKIIEKCMSEIQPFPSSLKEKLAINEDSQHTQEQLAWLFKLNNSILSVQYWHFCKDEQEKAKCFQKKQQLNKTISSLSKKQKKEFQYIIPTSLPSFALKK